MAKRKYNDSYVSFGFTCFIDDDGTEKPQCFLCGKILANCSMKPAKLKLHFGAYHAKNR